MPKKRTPTIAAVSERIAGRSAALEIRYPAVAIKPTPKTIVVEPSATVSATRERGASPSASRARSARVTLLRSGSGRFHRCRGTRPGRRAARAQAGARSSAPFGRPAAARSPRPRRPRSEEHTSELQSRPHLVCRLLLEKKTKKEKRYKYKKKKKQKKTEKK